MKTRLPEYATSPISCKTNHKEIELVPFTGGKNQVMIEDKYIGDVDR